MYCASDYDPTLTIGRYKFVHTIQKNDLDKFGRENKKMYAVLSPVLPDSIRSFMALVESAHFVPYLRALLKLIETEVHSVCGQRISG